MTLTSQLARTAALGAVVALLATPAFAAPRPQVGLSDPQRFTTEAHRTELTSRHAMSDVAHCWRRDARFVPLFSRFTGGPDKPELVYRLTENGRLYERVTMSSAADGKAIIVIEISPNYDAGWSAMVERDRLEPLRRCAGSVPTPTSAR